MLKLKQGTWKKFRMRAVFAFCSFILFTATAQAELDMSFGYVFSGMATPPANPTTPWVTTSFVNQGTNVLFTLTGTANLTGTENISDFYFNFNDSLNLSALHLSLVSTSGLFTLPTITLNQNSLKADGDGKYDVKLEFATGGATNQTFSRNDSIQFNLYYTGTGTFDETSFGFLSFPAGGSGPFYGAAHIQNTTGGQSAWISATTFTIIPVPEPSSIALLGIFLLGGLLCAKKRR